MTRSSANVIIDPKKFSSLKHLVHVTGWVQRCLTNGRLPMNSQRKDRICLPTEISGAETFWIKQTQAQAFPGGEKEGLLTRLNRKHDSNGLLRLDGHLRFTDELPYETRHPILLPKDHPVTKLVVLDAHERLGHGAGVEQVMTELQSHFWIVKGRRMVRSVTEACAECRHHFTKKIGNLFTCLTTRAVHLEMSYSLDTDSFINAFIRMTSRRGTPTYLGQWNQLC